MYRGWASASRTSLAAAVRRRPARPRAARRERSPPTTQRVLIAARTSGTAAVSTTAPSSAPFTAAGSGSAWTAGTRTASPHTRPSTPEAPSTSCSTSLPRPRVRRLHARSRGDPLRPSRLRLQARIAPEYVIENVFDVDHFKSVHAVGEPAPHALALRRRRRVGRGGLVRGAREAQQMAGLPERGRRCGTDAFPGPSLQSHAGRDGIGSPEAPNVVVTSATPTPDGDCVIRVTVAMARLPDGTAPTVLSVGSLMSGTRTAFEQDLEIWEHLDRAAPSNFAPSDIPCSPTTTSAHRSPGRPRCNRVRLGRRSARAWTPGGGSRRTPRADAARGCCGSIRTRWTRRSSAAAWRRLPEWRHLAVDLPGHGASRRLVPGDGLAGLTQELGRFAEERRRPPRRRALLRNAPAGDRRAGKLRESRAFRPGLASGPQEPAVVRRYLELAALYHAAGAGPHMTELWMRSPPDIFRQVARRADLARRLAAIVDRHRWDQLADAAMLGFTRPAQDQDALEGVCASTLLVLGKRGSTHTDRARSSSPPRFQARGSRSSPTPATSPCSRSPRPRPHCWPGIYLQLRTRRSPST